jgi:hypothetical protein
MLVKHNLEKKIAVQTTAKMSSFSPFIKYYMKLDSGKLEGLNLKKYL